MKVSDFGPRYSPFVDTIARHFRGRKDLVVAELGVDAGAHAEAIMRTGRVGHLDLVDPWEGSQVYTMGICKGRLDALGFHGHYRQIDMSAQQWVATLGTTTYDGIYCDLPQEANLMKELLPVLWVAVGANGIIGIRNYAPGRWPALCAYIDHFVAQASAKVLRESYHNEIILFR